MNLQISEQVSAMMTGLQVTTAEPYTAAETRGQQRTLSKVYGDTKCFLGITIEDLACHPAQQ
jgi:hypothetical protein